MLNAITQYLASINPILAALYVSLFTWMITAAGASLVFIFKGTNRTLLDAMLGFAGGVMLAASFWSLLAPGIEMSPGVGFAKVIPAIIGFTLGALFIYGADKIIPSLLTIANENSIENTSTSWHKTILLILAITLHNIPEGLAIGVLFGGIANGLTNVTIGSAVALAIGIGLQNFPEGLAVAMPLRRQGLSKFKCFWYGQLSAIVEPIAAVVGVLAVGFFTPILPYALSFAAGAMIYVVIKEIIPEAQLNNNDISTLGFIGGFIIMMTLDVGLG